MGGSSGSAASPHPNVLETDVDRAVVEVAHAVIVLPDFSNS